jgi:hypothetical protein
MKVGVISRGSPDYLIDIVTDGLIRVVGRSNLSIDYNVRFAADGKGPYQHLCQGMEGPEPFDLRDADILVASIRSLKEARQWKVKTGRTKIALIDGEDLGGIDAGGVAMAKMYFKREYFHFTPYPPNVRPLPFAAIPEALPTESSSREKVFYSGHPNHPFRNEITAALSSMGFPPAANQDKKDYNRSLRASLVGVAVRGMGWDTYRYWEIPYFGAALLSQRPGHVIPANFIEGEEAAFYDTAGDFQQKLRGMLAKPEETLRMAAAGHKAIQERHLSIHRARTILESLA